MLEGYRGHAPADVKALAEVLLRVSLLVEEVPEIAERDLNPIFALPPGQSRQNVDARLRVEPAKRSRAIPPAMPVSKPGERDKRAS